MNVILKIKDWLKNKDKKQYHFVKMYPEMVIRLKDGIYFNQDNFVTTTDSGDNVYKIVTFDDDRIHVYLLIDRGVPFLKIEINSITELVA